MSSNDCAGGPNDRLTKNLVDDLLREPKRAYMKFIHDGPYHQACMVDGLVERVQELGTELADTQRSLKAAHERQAKAETAYAEAKADAVRERANANNLGISLNKLRLQANGWKEENEQLRKELTDVHTSHALAQADYEHVAKERDQLRKDIGRLDAQLNEAGRAIQALSSENERAKYAIEAKNRLLDSKAAETLALKEELDLLNRNHGKLLALRDEQLDQAKARITELNRGIARAQETQEDRQTDARLFLELVRAGQDVDYVQNAIRAYNGIRKNGLTPKP